MRDPTDSGPIRRTHASDEEMLQYLRMERSMVQAIKRIEFNEDGTVSVLFIDGESETYRYLTTAATAIRWWFNRLVDKGEIRKRPEAVINRREN